MSQHYPPNAQPGQTPQFGSPQPPPKKKKRGCLYVFLGATVIGIIIAAASSNGSKGTSDPDPTPTRPALTGGKNDKSSASSVEQFKAYVAKNGTATEKAASQHVTKIQGADKKNDILDAPEVYTDYSGGITGPHTSDGKLIASTFADWMTSRDMDSKNGLVTVYDKTGEILSNGNY